MNTAPSTQLQVAQENFKTLKKFLAADSVKQAIASGAPKHLSPDRQLRIVLTAALNQPKIAEACLSSAGQASIMKAMLTASQRGLELDGRQGHLVPFMDNKLRAMTVQFIPGYQGLVDLAYNHPKVKSIWWNVVHDKDEFEFEDGLNRKMVHRKYAGDEDPGPLTHAYAVCEMDGGAKTFVCLNRREVMKSKGSSRGADSPYSPWSTHEPAMWAKTAVRALCKQIPQSAELRDVLADDDEMTRPDPEPTKATVEGPSFISAPTQTMPEPEPEPEPDDGDLAPQKENPAPKAAAKAVNLVKGVRGLCKVGGVEESDLLAAMRESGMDDSLSSLEEAFMADPKRLEHVYENWSNPGGMLELLSK